MVVIIGGGLAGMSTAYHLGNTPCTVLEAGPVAGGLCGSRTIDGFVFDYTGHLLHLRDPRIVALIDEWLPGVFSTIERKAYIHSHDVRLPFPFQANLHGLPPEVVSDCLMGFIRSLDVPVPDSPEVDFETWSLAVFGRGISDAFMLPYNEKLFRRAPAEMTADWVAWAVPKPNLEQVVQGALGVVNRGLGYNSTFRYPTRGGIEVLPNALAERVRDRIRLNAEVRRVDMDRQVVTLADGEQIAYDELVVTTPLPRFLNMLEGPSSELSSRADRLDWSVVGCLNLGIDRPGVGGDAHWIYFPDDDSRYYRAGFPTNFSEGVAPEGTSSLYVEFGLRRGEVIDEEAVSREAIADLTRQGILRPDDRILVQDFIRIDPGYVIFDRDRQAVMNEVVPALSDRGVHLIGRYGAWTYSYMERALLDGLELAERLSGCNAAQGRQGALGV